MRPPRKNQPRYPAASFRSSAMVISLLLRKPGHEDVEALLQSGRHAAELAGAREPGQAVYGPADAFGYRIHALGHFTHALDLVLGLSCQLPDVVGERMGLAHERPQLLLDDRQHTLRASDHPPKRQNGRNR